MALATGWGREEFRLVSPDFKAALKHALYAQRVVPILNEHQDVVNMSDADLSTKGKAQLGSAKLAARKQIATIRSYLDLDDG